MILDQNCAVISCHFDEHKQRLSGQALHQMMVQVASYPQTVLGNIYHAPLLMCSEGRIYHNYYNNCVVSLTTNNICFHTCVCLLCLFSIVINRIYPDYQLIDCYKKSVGDSYWMMLNIMHIQKDMGQLNACVYNMLYITCKDNIPMCQKSQRYTAVTQSVLVVLAAENTLPRKL